MFSKCFWCWNAPKEVPEFQRSQKILKRISESKIQILSIKCKKATSSVLDFFEHLRSRTRFSFLHESCSSSSHLSKEFWMTSFGYPSEELLPKYERCAELKKYARKLFYFILFHFIFQCGAHKQKELKKNWKENQKR